MSDLFDRFSGSAGALGSHSADSSEAWSVGASNVALSGGGSIYAVSTATNGTQPLSAWAPPGTDYAVSAVVGADWVTGGGSGGVWGPIVRGSGAPDSETYYTLLVLGSPPSQQYVFVRVVGGDGGTQIGGIQNFGSQVNANDVLTLSVAGSGATITLTFYKNGTQVAQVTDTSGARITTAGKAGIYVATNGAPNTDQIRALWAGAAGSGPPAITVAPPTPTVAWLASQSFALSTSLPNETFSWSATHGSISGALATETYTAPSSGSSDTVTGTSIDLPTRTASATVTLVDTATKLVVTTQPPGSTATGSPFGLVVSAEDSSSVVVTTYTGNVTVAIGTNPGSGTLSGTLTVAAVAGVATFAGLSINNAGTGYTLAATAGGLSSATTSTFNITAGTATSFTETGPSSGFNHNASSNFTFTPNANYTGTITPTMSVIAGTWSPTTLTWSAASNGQSATFTPSATGSGNANGTASPSLTQPSNVAYTSNSQTLAVSPGTVQVSSSGNALTLTGGGTLWTPGTPGSPTFTASSGTITAQTVSSTTAATLTFTAPGSAGSVTITDPGTGATATVAVANTVNCLTAVSGFPGGLIGGTTAGFGYEISTNGGSYGSLITSGITESATGTYTAIAAVTAAALISIKWATGSGAFAIDASPQFLPSTGSLNLAGTLSAPRALDSVADAAITVNDALWCAVAQAAGKQTTAAGTPPTLTVKTPSTGTTIRTLRLDQLPNPTSRN